MLLLQAFTVTLLVSLSRGIAEDYYWGSADSNSGSYEYYSDEDEYNIGIFDSDYSSSYEVHIFYFGSEDSISTSHGNVHRAANFKDSECPPDESFLSKKDVIDMINYIESEMNVINNINETYYPEAVEARDKVFDAFLEIKTRLETRPEHLEHILQDIDATHIKLERIVDDIVLKLQDVKIFEDHFLQVNDRAQDVLDKLSKYKHLCQFNNCEERNMMTRQNLNPDMENYDDNYYCASLKDLHERINMSLTGFKQDYQVVMKDRIKQDYNEYEKIISGVRSQVKQSALSMFGATMYDILSLQDDYHHYAEDLNIKTNLSAEFDKIKIKALELEYSLLELTDGVEKYHNYCLHCTPKGMRQRALVSDPYGIMRLPLSRELPYPTTPEVSNELIQNLEADPLNIDEIIKAKIDGYKRVIDNDYINIFEELNSVLYDPTLIESLVNELVPVEENVRYQLAGRQEALMNLKSKLPQARVNEVYELSKKYKQLLNSVQAARDFVNMYV